MAPRETENNAYAKFLSDKKKALWYVMVFSGVVNYIELVGKYTLSVANLISTIPFPIR